MTNVLRTPAFFIITVGTIGLVGCAPTGFNTKTGMFDPPAIVRTGPVVIRLIPSDPNRVDPFSVVSTQRPTPYDKILTGPFWNPVFVGNDESNASFTIESAKMSLQHGRDRRTYTYYVSGYVTCSGTNVPIASAGVRWTSRQPEKAMGDAINRAIADAAKKAESIATNCRLNKYKPNETPPIEALNQQLTLLNDLREQGIITESEYQAQKEKLLESD